MVDIVPVIAAVNLITVTPTVAEAAVLIVMNHVLTMMSLLVSS